MNNIEKIPELLLQRLKQQYNENELEQIINGYNATRKVTIRVNTIKSNLEKVCEQLEENNISYKKVLWSETALIINEAEEEPIQELDIYKNGEIYMQSLSSMLPPIILNPKQGTDILDMAAAPGGKTTQMAAITENKAFITACEINKLRAERLKYNIEKQGASSVNIMSADARKLDDYFSFNQILLDAPCSGSGTINLNNTEKQLLFTENFENKLEKTQTELLEKAIKLLKNGNEMVYSTCSILFKENENIINKIIKKANLEVVPIKFEGMEEIPMLPCKLEGALCVCPNELYEGFFVVKLKKNK